MDKTIIGTAKVSYNENGQVVEASFIPALKVDLSKTPQLGQQLLDIKCDTQENIQKNADLILGAWFVKMDDKINEIETADRERYQVASKIIECENYPNGKVKTCALEYVFQERTELLN